MSIGHRHWLLRRRRYLKTVAKPASLVLGVDMLAITVSILSLVFTLDQVRIIWVEHNASGVSFLSWVFYTASASVWLCYGLLHRDKVIMITNCAWVLFSLFIVIGIAIYA